MVKKALILLYFQRSLRFLLKAMKVSAQMEGILRIGTRMSFSLLFRLRFYLTLIM